MVWILQGMTKNALLSGFFFFKNHTFVHPLETCCNTETCLNELHPISGSCIPRGLSTVECNDGDLPSIVFLNGTRCPLLFLQRKVRENLLCSRERVVVRYFVYYQEMICHLHMLRYAPSYTLELCVSVLSVVCPCLSHLHTCYVVIDIF